MERNRQTNWAKCFRTSMPIVFIAASLLLPIAHSASAWSSRVGAGLSDSKVPALAPTATPSAPTSTSPANLGDGNGDGRCTEVDALVALQMVVGLQTADVARMDVNGDGKVTEVDALQILKWAVTGGQCSGISPAQPFSEDTVKTKEEAIEIADEIISKEFPDMVDAEKAIQSYATQYGEFYDITYKRSVEIESAGEIAELPRVVIVTIDKKTGEPFIAVSD